ncbi:MAG: hypothetical protein U1G05_16130 [Kiritimatiellia bacterium]
MHPLRVLLKAFLLLLTGMLASCSKPEPAAPPPAAVPPAPPLPVLGELPDLHLTDAKGVGITTASLLGKRLLLWFPTCRWWPPPPSRAGRCRDRSRGAVRKIVLVPMPALLAPIRR